MKIGIGISAGTDVVCAVLLVEYVDDTHAVDYRTISADGDVNSDIGELVASAIEVVGLPRTFRSHVAGTQLVDARRTRSPCRIAHTEQASSIRSALAHSDRSVLLVPRSRRGACFPREFGIGRTVRLRGRRRHRRLRYDGFHHRPPHRHRSRHRSHRPLRRHGGGPNSERPGARSQHNCGTEPAHRPRGQTRRAEPDFRPIPGGQGAPFDCGFRDCERDRGRVGRSGFVRRCTTTSGRRRSRVHERDCRVGRRGDRGLSFSSAGARAFLSCDPRSNRR